MGRTVTHPPPFQTRYRFRLDFLPMVAFRYLSPTSYLPTLLPIPNTPPPPLHLSGMWPDIQWLHIKNGGGEELSEVLQCLKIIKCGLRSQLPPASHPRCSACGGNQLPPPYRPILGPGQINPLIPPTMAQRGPQPKGWYTGHNVTPAGATFSGWHRSSGGMLSQIPPGVSPLQPKFPPYAPLISVWTCHTPSKN